MVIKMKHLGKNSKQFSEPSIKILEKIRNKNKQSYLVRFIQPEFTSLCPVTSQQDFAHIVIDYVPNKWIVESKSLKLYYHSFRNHQSFHEDVTMQIANDISKILEPKWFRIGAYWYPRGGIPIDIFWQSSLPPKDLWIPDQGVENYRGRG